MENKNIALLSIVMATIALAGLFVLPTVSETISVSAAEKDKPEKPDKDKPEKPEKPTKVKPAKPAKE
jgi:hypothetical protein